MGRIKTFFVTGMAILIPLAITVFFLRLLFSWVDGFLQPLLTPLLPRYYPGLGVVISLGLVLLTGALATNLLGQRLIELGQGLLMRTPFVRGIYSMVRQVVDAFFDAANTPFRRVVLLEYPRLGLYTLGFLTSDARGEIQERTQETTVNVFIPTTPNPTSGFLIMVPESHLIRLDMSVDEGLRLVMSGGILTPANGESEGGDTLVGSSDTSRAAGPARS